MTPYWHKCPKPAAAVCDGVLRKWLAALRLGGSLTHCWWERNVFLIRLMKMIRTRPLQDSSFNSISPVPKAVFSITMTNGSIGLWKWSMRAVRRYPQWWSQTVGLNIAAFPDFTQPPLCFHFISGVTNHDSIDQTPVAKSKNQECEPSDSTQAKVMMTCAIEAMSSLLISEPKWDNSAHRVNKHTHKWVMGCELRNPVRWHKPHWASSITSLPLL